MAGIPVLLPLVATLLQVTSSVAVESYAPTIGLGLEDRWRWRDYPEVAGLGVLCVEEGGDGNIWVGGDNGAMSYDGWDWTTYGRDEGLDGGAVNDLLATADGNLFAGTERGLFEFDPSAAFWNRLAPPDCELDFHIHRMIGRSDGSVLMATVWGLVVYDHGAWSLTSSRDMLAANVDFGNALRLEAVPNEALPLEEWGVSPGIKVVENDFISSGRENYPLLIWAVAGGSSADQAGVVAGDEVLGIDGGQPYQAFYALGGVPSTSVSVTVRRRSDGEVVDLELERADLDGGVRAFSITDVIEDSGGGLWFGEVRLGNVVHRAGDSGGGEWSLHAPASGLSIPGTVRLCETADGRIWKISQSGDAPMEVYSKNGGWEPTHDARYNPDSNSDNIHTSIIETDDGLLWVGGHDGSIHVLRDGGWMVFNSSRIPTPKVRLVDIVESSGGDLWIAGSHSGLSRFLHNTGRWRIYENLVFCTVDGRGGEWFYEGFERVVARIDDEWLRFDPSDGLIQHVWGVLSAGDQVIAFGEDAGTAAIAVFDRAAFSEGRGRTWNVTRIPDLASRLDENAVLHAGDGSLWFGASNVVAGQRGGFVRFDGTEPTYYPGSSAPMSPYALVQDSEGDLWAGGPLMRFDGSTWTRDGFPPEVQSHVHDLAITGDGSLWVATRFYGVMRMLEGRWTRYSLADGLPDNRVEGLFVDRAGVLWASTPRGVGRFDGQSWNHDIHGFDVVFDNLRGSIRPGLDEDIWFVWKNRSIRHRPDRSAPRTEILNARDRYFDAGTLTFKVTGRDALAETEPGHLAFSHRMDGGAWSAFHEGGLLQVSSVGFGEHRLEVRARDWDYNVDESPAVLAFTVVRPVWQRWWFVVGAAGLVGFLVLQTVRLIERDRRMLAVNRELRLRGAELEAANEELRGFSYAISHDLRAPLRHLAGYSSMLEDDFGDKLGDEGARMIGRIRNATHRLEDLVEGLLTLCRATNSELRRSRVDVTKLATEVSHEAAREHWQERGRFEIQEHMGVTGDHRLIRVVLENLLGNAAKFSARVECPVVKVDLMRNGAEAVIRVSDNGAGFNMNYAENLFQPFRRLHSYDSFKGTGIGLATVSRIVRRHGGRIWAEAEEGKGAAFHAAFPVRPA